MIDGFFSYLETIVQQDPSRYPELEIHIAADDYGADTNLLSDLFAGIAVILGDVYGMKCANLCAIFDLDGGQMILSSELADRFHSESCISNFFRDCRRIAQENDLVLIPGSSHESDDFIVFDSPKDALGLLFGLMETKRFLRVFEKRRNDADFPDFPRLFRNFINDYMIIAEDPPRLSESRPLPSPYIH